MNREGVMFAGLGGVNSMRIAVGVGAIAFCAVGATVSISAGWAGGGQGSTDSDGSGSNGLGKERASAHLRRCDLTIAERRRGVWHCAVDALVRFVCGHSDVPPRCRVTEIFVSWYLDEQYRLLAW